MNQKYFVLKLLPCRPTFTQDMTAEEGEIMQQHGAYWTHLMNKGIAVVFGLVFDPKGAYGMGIVKADNEDEVNLLIARDPATKINTYEFYPMRAITKQ